MRSTLLAILMSGLLFTACNNSKKAAAPDHSNLEGGWQLNYISGPRIAFDGLYPDKKPQLKFDIATGKVTGNTGCNSLSGTVKIDGNTISFGEFITTRMACPGEGESVFLQTIRKITSYSITDGNTLNLIMGDVAMMRFVKI